MDRTSLRRSAKSAIQTKKEANKVGARVLAEFKQKKLKLPDPTSKKRRVTMAKAPEAQALAAADDAEERETMAFQKKDVAADG
jgi:hypothetical protein